MDNASLIKAGRLLGVEAVLTGTVNRYNPHVENVFLQRRVERVTQKDGQGNIIRDSNGYILYNDEVRETQTRLIEAEVDVNARLVDVETGLVVWASSYKYRTLDIADARANVVSRMVYSLKDALANKAYSPVPSIK